jgi:hypothetical protein
VVVLAFALVGTGAALLLGSLVGDEQQAAPIALLLALGLAALGGSMAPLEVCPDAARTIAHVTPDAWANDAFCKLLRHGGGLLDVAPQVLVLLGFATVALVLAAWRLRRAITGRGPGTRTSTAAEGGAHRMAREANAPRLDRGLMSTEEDAMATATKKTPAKKIRTAPPRAAARKPVEKSTLDYLQHALDDLKKAREKAQHDVRANIDSAIERIRKALGDFTEELRHPKDKRA